MSIKAVIFDFGNVLARLNFPRMFETISSRSRRDASVVRSLFLPEHSPTGETSETVTGKATAGRIFAEEHLATLHAKAGYLGTLEELERDYHLLFVDRIEETIALMQSLSSRYKTGVLSNTNALAWKRALELVPEIRSLSYRFLSFELHLVKPDPNLYFQVANTLELAPEEVAFIDDSIDIVRGAAACGLTAIHFTSPAALFKDLAKIGV